MTCAAVDDAERAVRAALDLTAVEGLEARPWLGRVDRLSQASSAVG